MEFGTVQGVIDWKTSVGAKLKAGPGMTGGVRLTRLKSHGQTKEVQDGAGVHRVWNVGDELVVAYTPLMVGEYETAEDTGKAEVSQEDGPRRQ